MNLFFRKVLRFLLMRWFSSKVPTGLVPLSDVKSVVVYVDFEEEHCQPAIIHVTSFFKKYGISVRVVSENSPKLRSESDMFLALNYVPCFSERYAAKTSKARCKVGRHQIRGNVYDVVISEPGEVPMKVDAFFKEMKSYLTLVK